MSLLKQTLKQTSKPALLMVAAVVAGCPAPTPVPPTGPVWSPGTTLPSSHDEHRGLVDVRGLVHTHSIYSHDACDNAPVDDNGVRDAVCLDDWRRGMCQTRHDFVMLTDHSTDFENTEFPDTLLFFAQRGDVLVEHDVDVDGTAQLLPTANRTTCDDGTVQLILAGSESGLMPVGLERHATDDNTLSGTRTYGTLEQRHADAIHSAGGLVMLAHPEDFTVEQLKLLPIDGFEMYNLHRNTLASVGVALELVLRINDGDVSLPHPDLVLAPIFQEDPLYLERWGRVLASGLKRTTTMGTDSHQNTFRTPMADGERVDSFRRMMSGFSNHVLVDAAQASPLDDRALKTAMRAGRVYGAFEYLGHPRGFDVRAVDGETITELGGEANVGATITVTRPTLQLLDPSAEAPLLTVRVLRAIDDEAGWEVVAIGEHDDVGDLEHVVTVSGAYRAEVRMVPLHLRAFFGADDEVLLADGRDFVWIYSNALYIKAAP